MGFQQQGERELRWKIKIRVLWEGIGGTEKKDLTSNDQSSSQTGSDLSHGESTVDQQLHTILNVLINSKLKRKMKDTFVFLVIQTLIFFKWTLQLFLKFNLQSIKYFYAKIQWKFNLLLNHMNIIKLSTENMNKQNDVYYVFVKKYFSVTIYIN